MYINFRIAKKYGLAYEDIIVLQAIKQNRTEDMYDVLCELFIGDLARHYTSLGLIEHVKPKKKDHTLTHCVRLTEKARDILELVETPEIDPDDTIMFDHLCKIYLQQGCILAEQEGTENKRTIGNKKKTLLYICQFRKIVGLTLYEMYYLCELYVRESVYTLILERIFFDSNKNRYGKFKDNVEDSKLFQFYDQNKERVQEYWKLKIK